MAVRCGAWERDEWAEQQSSLRAVKDGLNSLLLHNLSTPATLIKCNHEWWLIQNQSYAVASAHTQI